MKTSFLAAAFAAALAMSGIPTQAQTTPDPHQHDGAQADAAAPSTGAQADPMMQMMSGMMGMMKMMHGHGMAGMGMSGIGGMGVADHIEGRIAFLHAELKIAGDQEMLWAAFADVMRENAKASTAAASHGDAASTGIVGALNAQSAALEAKLAAVNKLGTTLNPLYAALSEEQKKLADELIGPQIGMGSAKRGGGVMPGTMGGMAGSAD